MGSEDPKKKKRNSEIPDKRFTREIGPDGRAAPYAGDHKLVGDPELIKQKQDNLAVVDDFIIPTTLHNLRRALSIAGISRYDLYNAIKVWVENNPTGVTNMENQEDFNNQLSGVLYSKENPELSKKTRLTPEFCFFIKTSVLSEASEIFHYNPSDLVTAVYNNFVLKMNSTYGYFPRVFQNVFIQEVIRLKPGLNSTKVGDIKLNFREESELWINVFAAYNLLSKSEQPKTLELFEFNDSGLYAVIKTVLQNKKIPTTELKQRGVSKLWNTLSTNLVKAGLILTHETMLSPIARNELGGYIFSVINDLGFSYGSISVIVDDVINIISDPNKAPLPQ